MSNPNSGAPKENADEKELQKKSLVTEISFASLDFTRLLGTGNFGEIWHGQWQLTDVAIKKIPGAHSFGESILDELRREAALHERLRHPNIIALYGAVTTDPRCACLVLEYAPGGSLYDFLHGDNSVLLSREDQLSIAGDVAAGIAHLHASNIYHRDLKSPNVVRGADGRFKVCDFGLARAKQKSVQVSTRGRGAVGTPAWMAPELLDDEVDPKLYRYDKIDVYALGMVFYEIVTQSLPFSELGPSQITMAVVCRNRRPQLNDKKKNNADPSLISLMEECWKQDPNERPSADREMLEKLGRQRHRSVMATITKDSMVNVTTPSTETSTSTAATSEIQPPPINPEYNSKIATNPFEIKPSAPPLTIAPHNTRPSVTTTIKVPTQSNKTERSSTDLKNENQGKVQEILTILAELRAEIIRCDVEKVKSVFLYLKSRMLAHNTPSDHELVISFLGCLEAYESASNMPRQLQVEFLSYLKHLALLNFSRQRYEKENKSKQVLDIERLIRPTITLNKIVFSDENKTRDEMSFFWRQKGLHALSTTELLHELQLRLASSKSGESDMFKNEDMSNTMKILAGDTRAIKILLAQGPAKVFEGIRTIKKPKVESRAIATEAFGLITYGYKDLSWSDTKCFADGVIELFVYLRGHLQRRNEWLILYSYLDALLNCVVRFNDPTDDDSLQLHLLDFFRNELPFQAKKLRQVRSGINKSELQVLSNLVEARLIEGIMQIKHSSVHASVQTRADEITKELCSMNAKKKKATGCILNFLKETEQMVGCNLTDIAALDTAWYKLMKKNQQHLLKKHPNIVKEAISCDAGSALSDAALKHVAISAEEEHKVIVQFSDKSKFYNSQNYWHCFCKYLIHNHQAGALKLSQINHMGSQDNYDDSDDLFVVKPFGFRGSSPKDYPSKGADRIPKVAAPPPVAVRREVKAISNDDFDPLVHNLLNDPDAAQLEIEESINCIRSIVAVCKKVNEKVDGQDVVVILGATGCGKSTAINWMSGCTMMKDEKTGNILVCPPSEGGSADQISAIGHDAYTSHTIVPLVIQLDESLSLCDAPGFIESRGAEIAIANAINILSIVLQSRSVGILQIINVYELMAAKGDSAKQSLQSLVGLFGGKENFNESSDKIMFGLNFVEDPRVLQRAKNRLLSLCEMSGWHIQQDNIICIDPLDDRMKMINFLKSRHRICGNKCAEMFTQAPLSEKDLLLLEKLNTSMFEWCKSTFSKGDIQGLLDNYVLLEEMSRISLNQGLFHQQMENIQKFIQESVKQIAEREVLELARQQSSSDRFPMIIKNMEQLQNYIPLDALFPSEGEHPIRAIFDDTVIALAEIEAAEQAQRNQEYEMKWKTIRIVLEKELDESIRRDPDAFSNIDLVDDEELLSSFVDACHFVGKVLNLMKQMKKEEYQRSDLYFSGNLCPLVGLETNIRKNATDIIRRCLRAVRCQQQVNICAAAIEELEGQNGIADTKYDMILGLALSSDEKKEDVLLYGIECLGHVGFNKNAISKLLNILPVLNKICCMEPPWPEKYDNVVGNVRSFIFKLNKQARLALIAATISQFKIDLNSLDAALESSLSNCVCMPESLEKYLGRTPALAVIVDSVDAALVKLAVDQEKLEAAKKEWERKKKELGAAMERCVSENALAEATNLFAELSHKCDNELLKARAINSMERLILMSASHAKVAQAKIREIFTFVYTLNGSIENHVAATEDFFSRGRMIRDIYIEFGWDTEELVSIEKKLKNNEEQILRDVNAQVTKSSSSLLEALRLGLAQYAEAKGKKMINSLECIDIEDHLFNEGFLTINTKEKIDEMQAMVIEAKGSLYFHDSTALDNANSQLKELVRKIGEETARFSAHMNDLQLVEKTRQDMEELCLSLETHMDSKFVAFSTKPLTLQALSDSGLFVSQATKVLYNLNRLDTDSPETIALRAEFDKRTTDVRRRAQLHLCQELASKIDFWCVSDEVSSHVRDIKKAFDVMKAYNSPRYEQKKATFLSFCSSKQDEGTILVNIKAKNYNAIFSSYTLIESLRDQLKDHMDIKLELDKTICEFLDSQYEKAKANIVCRVDNENFLDFSDLKDFMEFSRELRKPGQVERLKEYAKGTFSTFSIGQVARRRTENGVVVVGTEEVGVAAKTFVKFFAVATELEMTKKFTKQMNTFLAKMAPENIDMLSECIYELHSQSSLEKICSEILSRFKVFSRKNTAIENRIRGGVTFEAALSQLSSNEDINKSNLRQCYQRYKQVFNQLLDLIVQEQYNESEMIRSMRNLGKSIKPLKARSAQTRNQIAELVARVCVHYSYHDAQDTYFTGDKDTLLQVHATQVLSIFMLLGLDQSGVPVGNINEVLTGEGKSISLAMTAAIFCFMGMEAKVICYSIYLTHKDQTLFDTFFESLGISYMIEYTTIDWLTNSVMNASFPDLREQMQRFVQGKKLPVFRATKSKCVLLIDEVDVFFGPDFYGELYSPGQNLKGPEAFAVMKYLWSNRTFLLDLSREDAVSNVRAQKVLMQNFLAAYPRFDKLFDRIIHNCLNHLGWYYSKEGATTFNCEVVDDRIGWMDLRQGAISFTRISPSISFAYFFYNEQLRPDGTKCISDSSVKLNVGITVICGAVLYAELPKLFEMIVGVTGTLVSFGDDHKEILGNYGLRRLSNIPSTFDRKSVVVKPTQVVTGDRGDAYFDRIKAAIYDMVKAHRATLVFFETSAEMRRFQKELEKKTIKLPNYRPPELLCETVAPQKRDAIISRAINTNRVTLCTKTYMRGTDFKCRDSELSSLGGVHVIMTFMPSTAADEVQAKGRTCRQNDPGSYQKILFAQDLVDKNLLRTSTVDGKVLPDLSEADEMELSFPDMEENRWDLFLEKKRSAEEENTAKNIIKKLHDNAPKHELTLEMSSLMPKSDGQSLSRAAELLRSFN